MINWAAAPGAGYEKNTDRTQGGEEGRRQGKESYKERRGGHRTIKMKKEM